MEAEGPGGGTGGDAAVGCALADGFGGGEVSGGDAVVAGHSIGRDAGGAEMLVENVATAGSFVAIDEADVFSGQMLDAANLTGGARDQALFPDGKGHHIDGPVREEVFHDGEIVIAGGGIAQMGSGNVDFSLLQPLESLATAAGGDHDIEVVGEQRNAGIAAGDQETLFGFRFLEHLRFRAVDYDGVGWRERQVVGRGGDSDGAVADAAELHGLAGARGGDEVDGHGLWGGGGF